MLAYIRIYKVQYWVLSTMITIIGVILLFMMAIQVSHNHCGEKLWMLFGDYGMDIYMIGYYVQQAIFVVFGKILGISYPIYGWLMFIFGLITPIVISKYIVRKNKILSML